MARGIGIGIGKAVEGREAARQAVQQALESLGTARPVGAFVFFSQEYPVSEVVSGLGSLPGGLPLLGMSTTRLCTAAGDQARSVAVAILASSNWKTQTYWQAQYSQDSSGAGRALAQALATENEAWNALLLSGDGIQGEAEKVCQALTVLGMPVAGGLAAGEIQSGRTYQIGGGQWGNGALAAMALGGRFQVGIGLGQGWQDTGLFFNVTRARSVWLQGLDGVPPAEVYARIFGTPARQWAFPPLAQLVRQYPFGLEAAPGRLERTVRSPLQVEVDGGFRMNAALKEGDILHLMVGDTQACLDSARAAVRQALASLGMARPVFCLVQVDQAWQNLFETRPGQLASALCAELGETPFLGAYNLGQIARLPGSAQVNFFNQGILVTVIGET